MSWLGTGSGKRIDLINPDPSQFDLHDIALALSRTPRFNGHTNKPWSVLQHSMAVAKLVAKEYQLQAILHDASEAYICDVPSPMKRLLGQAYYDVEKRIQVAIGKKFGCELNKLPQCVKTADMIMLMTEHEALQDTRLEWEFDYSDGLRAHGLINTIPNDIDLFKRTVLQLQLDQTLTPI